jgi:hypothetical protein
MNWRASSRPDVVAITYIHSCAPHIGLSVSHLLHAGMGAILWWLAGRNCEGYAVEQVTSWLPQLSHAAISVSVRVPEAPGNWLPRPGRRKRRLRARLQGSRHSRPIVDIRDFVPGQKAEMRTAQPGGA